MKRIMTLFLAAGIIFSAQQAQAADIKVRGSWDFSFEFLDNVNVQKQSERDNDQDTFGAKQRLRTQIDIAASESLSGTIYFEIGDTVWGQKGGALGTDGVTVEVKRSYIDWMMPYSDLQIRMGLQGYALPGFVAGSPILDDDAAGITLSYTFDEMISLTAFWARPYDLNADMDSVTNAITDNDQYDEMDMFGIIVPINVDGMKIVPWAMYANIGESVYGAATSTTSLTGYNSGSFEAALAGLAPVANASGASYNLDSTASAWWAGLSYELNLFDPLSFKLDGIYGGVDTGEDALDRSGWLLIAALDYQMDMMTPGIFGWYGSGDDGSTGNGSEMMPYVSPDFGPTSFGMAYYASDISTSSVLSMSAAGTWAIGLQLADLTFIEDLSHIFRVTYFNGTNDKNAVKNSSLDSPAVSGFGIYLTEEDNAIEVNFDTTYQIYENLTMVAELGYIDLNLDSSVWGSGYDSYDNMWKVSFNLKYAF